MNINSISFNSSEWLQKADELEEKAIKCFGKTRYYGDAGYITRSGIMLDFHIRGFKPVIHHDEIERIFDSDELVASCNNEFRATNLFENFGAIRYGYNCIRIVRPLTAAQKDVLTKGIRKIDGIILVDFALPNGEICESHHFSSSVFPKRIISIIDEYFAERGS